MKVVSLFSGAGGFDLGMRMAGHEIVWANDLYSDAVKTYEMNLGGHVVLSDIREVSSFDIPDCDIVIGGFPCQGFSVANIGRHIKDERNFLYLEMLRVIEDKKPKYFFAENVKGLLSMDEGKVFEQIKNDFSGLGYRVKHALLNAADYGVPQRRERVIIFGVRRDICDEGIHFPPHPTHGLLSGRPWVSVGDALADLPEPGKGGLHNHECSKYKLRFNGYLGHRFVDPDKPAPTVTARGDEKGGVVVIHHPSNQRRMTARELALVQSFPLNFKFFGTKTSAYRQIANAVPPLLAFALGKVIK